jgi:hypothetical protein
MTQAVARVVAGRHRKAPRSVLLPERARPAVSAHRAPEGGLLRVRGQRDRRARQRANDRAAASVANGGLQATVRRVVRALLAHRGVLTVTVRLARSTGGVNVENVHRVGLKVTARVVSVRRAVSRATAQHAHRAKKARAGPTAPRRVVPMTRSVRSLPARPVRRTPEERVTTVRRVAIGTILANAPTPRAHASEPTVARPVHDAIPIVQHAGTRLAAPAANAPHSRKNAMGLRIAASAASGLSRSR